MVQENSVRPFNSIIIAGATATSKTDISLYIARKIGGEIINIDSQQVYLDLNIGVAKVSETEKNLVPHHMLDIVDAREKFSISDYVNLAKNETENIWKKGKIPIFVGGSGFYIDAMIKGEEISTSFDENIRQNLITECEKLGLDAMYRRLCEVDSVSANKIGKNDKKRILRALEIYYITGNARSCSTMQSGITENLLNPLIIYTTCDREVLYQRIDKRVDHMIASGLIDEVKNLLNSGVKPSSQSMSAIGYKETISYLEGKIDYNTLIDTIKINTRHYAKRQMTWFRHHLVDPIEIDMTNGLNDDVKSKLDSIISTNIKNFNITKN